MKASGNTVASTALGTKKSTTTIAEALVGECKKMSTLWDIAGFLGGKWEYLFKLDLPESQFRRAVVRAGNLGTVR